MIASEKYRLPPPLAPDLSHFIALPFEIPIPNPKLGKVHRPVGLAMAPDGSLYLSARTSGDGPLERSIVTSADRGASWSPKQFDKSLFDPHCEASLLALPSASKKKLIPPT